MDVGFEYAMTMSAEGPRNERRSLNALQELLTTLFEKIHVNELSVKQLNADFKVQANDVDEKVNILKDAAANSLKELVVP